MKVLDDCHTYELDTFMDPEDPRADNFPPQIHFYEMRPDGTRIDGVTNEEVLSVLIHRMKILNEKFPCDENRMAIKNLEGAQVWLTLRTQDRMLRGVEGTHQI